MSSGVGFGGSSAAGGRDGAGGARGFDGVRGGKGGRSGGACCAGWVGVAAVGRFVGWMVVGSLGRRGVAGAEDVGLSGVMEVRDVRDGVLAKVLLESGGWCPSDLVFVLLLIALSSSSDERSTTVWANITGLYAFGRVGGREPDGFTSS